MSPWQSQTTKGILSPLDVIPGSCWKNCGWTGVPLTKIENWLLIYRILSTFSIFHQIHIVQANTIGIPVYMVTSLLHINFTQHSSYTWIHTTNQAFICYENWFQHLPPLDKRVLHNTLSHNTPFNMFTNTFASNLYIIPTRLIGLTSFTSRARGHTIIQFSTWNLTQVEKCER